MTVTEAPADSSGASSEESRSAGRSIVSRLLLRWLLLVAATVVAYWHNIGQWYREIFVYESDLSLSLIHI